MRFQISVAGRALVGALLLTGCVSVPSGTSLGTAPPAPRRVEASAWLAPVAIDDSAVVDRDGTAGSMTLSLQQYLQESGRFRSVGILPGVTNPDDLILQFRFDRFRQSRKPHPLYFPAAVLTLTLYIWLGGPIYSDTTDLGGSLTVMHPDGGALVTVQASRQETRGTGFLSPQYFLPSGMTTRTALIEELLERSLGSRPTQLSTSGATP